MNARMKRVFSQALIGFCALVAFSAFGQEVEIPKHLQVARDIVANVKPENNSYSNKPRYIRFPGDFLTSEYTVRTDCTGFTEAIIDRAYGLSPKFSTKKLSYAYSIIDWVDGVDRGEMLDKIERVEDLKPGDFVMWKYLIYPSFNPAQINGHILTVDSKPVKVEPQRKPVMEGMTQWEIGIIDSGTAPMSSDDTRFVKIAKVPDGMKWEQTQRNGAGRGRFYIYSNEKGEIMGTAAVFQRAKVLVQDVDRHIVMARIRYSEIKK